jgi:hypothetical protein
MEYNYITSAAFDVGLALSAIIIFFCVVLPGGAMPNYWGSTIVSTTLDGAYAGNVQKTVSGDDTFGPKTWKW